MSETERRDACQQMSDHDLLGLEWQSHRGTFFRGEEAKEWNRLANEELERRGIKERLT